MADVEEKHTKAFSRLWAFANSMVFKPDAEQRVLLKTSPTLIFNIFLQTWDSFYFLLLTFKSPLAF